MGKFNTHLTEEDLGRIVIYLRADFGSGLSKDYFSEAFFLALENVPGCEDLIINESGILEEAYRIYCGLDQSE